MIIRDNLNGNGSKSHILKVSLWLIPQEPDNTKLKKQIHQLSDTYDLPKFDPHITIVGGEVIQNESDVDIILKRLKCTFKSFGPITCSFSSNKVYHGLNEGSVKWNQSCIAILDPNEKFNQAMYLAHQCFHPCDDRGEEKIIKDQIEEKGQPHFSFAYGMNDVGANGCVELEVPGTFTCSKAALYWTYPSCLVGVPQWRLIGEIFLN